MREKLNSNPLAQVAVVGILLLLAGVFVLSSMGGKGGDSGNSTTSSATVTTPQGTASVTATVTPSSSAAPAVSATPSGALPSVGDVAPPVPRPVANAWAADETVVLLFVRDGGIDDRKVAATVDQLHGVSGVSTFVVPASQIARYAAIAQGVEINRVPALVVIRPKRLDKGIPTASVHYGFQSFGSVAQAVVDANYKGRTVTYHP